MTDAMRATREGLLDALDALSAHRDALILVGAQAVYLHTGEAEVAIAEFTNDGDIAVDPELLGNDPLIEEAMEDGGFERINGSIGSWISDLGTPIDLMVPALVAGAGTPRSRGVDAPPHDRHSMRRTVGLEAALVDNRVMTIRSIDDATDTRAYEIKVAGPAALLVAKLHKIHDRLDQLHRQINKDAHDV